jgi:hypothetical protein
MIGLALPYARLHISGRVARFHRLFLFGFDSLLDRKGNHFARLTAFLHHPVADNARPALAAFAHIGIALRSPLPERCSCAMMPMAATQPISRICSVGKRERRIGREHQRKDRDHGHGAIASTARLNGKQQYWRLQLQHLPAMSASMTKLLAIFDENHRA